MGFFDFCLVALGVWALWGMSYIMEDISDTLKDIHRTLEDQLGETDL